MCGVFIYLVLDFTLFIILIVFQNNPICDKIVLVICMIASLENQKVKYLCKLNQSKYRKKEGMFIVEGKHLVDEAKKYGILVEAFSINEVEGYTQLSIPVMNKICNTNTVVTEIGLCKMIEKKEISNKILILDGVQDPGNMGALMRSACAFGFNTIVLGEGCVDIYNDKVIRSSQGAIFKLNFVNTNLVEFINNLTDYQIYGTDVVNGIELDKVDLSAKIGVVLGNEGNGVSKAVKEILKRNIYIPMENTESLNVSVAGGIIMYNFR